LANYNRKDALYRKAKEAGYASRGSWKLVELDKKFQLLSSVSSVLDLGCSPGGWLQVLQQRLGEKSKIWGVDLLDCPAANSLRSVRFIQGDLYSEIVQKTLLEESGGFDLILSDMSPNLSGIRFRDAAASAALVEEALGLASNLLRSNGSFVAKIFPGSESDEVFEISRTLFKTVKRVNLKSTRTTSKEFYIVARGKIGRPEIGQSKPSEL